MRHPLPKLLIVALFGVAAAACGPTSSTSSSSGGGASSGGEGSSAMACSHFANIMGDVQAGILTDAELRTKISEVRDSATSTPVRNAATKMLAAITQHDKVAVVTAASDLADACKSA